MEQRGDLVLQPRLREADGDDVFAEFLVRIRVPLADQVEGGRDDLTLCVAEGRLCTPTTPTAASSSSLLLGLAVGPLEWANVQEVDVTRDRPAGPTAVVTDHRVVRHEVSDLELPFLQKERVPGRDLRKGRAPAAEDRDRVLLKPVDRVNEVDRADAVIVVGHHLEVDLLDGRGWHVPTRG